MYGASSSASSHLNVGVPPYTYSPCVSDGSPKSSVCWPSTEPHVANGLFRRCVWLRLQDAAS